MMAKGGRAYVPKRLKPNHGRPKKPKELRPAGRPSKWNESFPTLAQTLAQLGHSDGEIASKLRITLSTYYEWQKTFPSFSEKIREGRSQSITGMSFKALLKALEGGTKTKTKKTSIKNADGSLRETREEIEEQEVWPCKDTALKHLSVTDPHYKGIQEKLEMPSWVKEAKESITKKAEALRLEDKDTIVITPDKDDNE
jgi:transposase